MTMPADADLDELYDLTVTWQDGDDPARQPEDATERREDEEHLADPPPR